MVTNLKAKWRKFSKCHTLMFLASLDQQAMISNESKETSFWSDRKELTLSDLWRELSLGQHGLTIAELVLTFGGEWCLHWYKKLSKHGSSLKQYSPAHECVRLWQYRDEETERQLKINMGSGWIVVTRDGRTLIHSLKIQWQMLSM